LRKGDRPGQDCKFKTGKIILQQPIEGAQVKKMLRDGKDGFAHKIYFQEKQSCVQAFLVIKDGGTAFEFEPAKERQG